MNRCKPILWIALAVSLAGCGRVVGTASYPTYIFTHSEIVLFGYEDGTSLEVSDAQGKTIWRGNLRAGQHQVLNPGAGVYHIVGTAPYATLVGDPTTGAVMGYYALNQHGRGTSNLFYTYQSVGYPGLLGIGEGPRNFVIFAYQDGTSLTLSETDTGQVIWQGTLDAGQAHFEPELKHVFLTVQASQPVSALSYSDQGYYVPAETGSFIGRKFYTWTGNAGGWVHDLNIIAYTDDTTATVQDMVNGDVIWQGTLSAGQMQAVTNVNDRLLSVESSRDVVVSVSPTTSYDSRYAHMLFAQDETGAGIGKRFYYPALQGARLEIFAYEDGAEVEVRDAANSVVYEGSLNRGQSAALDSDHTLYTITSNRPVAALMDWGDQAGADFSPPYYAAPAADFALPTIIIPPWLPLAGLGVLVAGVGTLLYRWSRAQPRQPSRPGGRPGVPKRPGAPTWPVEKKSSGGSGADVTHGQGKSKDRPRPPI